MGSWPADSGRIALGLREHPSPTGQEPAYLADETRQRIGTIGNRKIPPRHAGLKVLRVPSERHIQERIQGAAACTLVRSEV